MRRAFTLIELLVVIAIIAILASILFPVFSRARENARRASCQSNLKQIGLGIMQYTQDYDERLPGSTDGTPGQNLLGGWTYYTNFPTSGTTYSPNLTFDPTKGSIYPYIKSAQVYVCPSDSTDQAQSYALQCYSNDPDHLQSLMPLATRSHSAPVRADDKLPAPAFSSDIVGFRPASQTCCRNSLASVWSSPVRL